MILLIKVVLLVAVTIHSSQADVKHVLDGSAHPPQHIHTNDCQHPNNAVPGSSSYWWLNNNAAFKQAYEYFQKCSEKGNCAPPVTPVQVPSGGCNPTGCTAASSNVLQLNDEHRSVDVSRNPFLNGQIPVQPPVSDSSRPDISKNPFLNGNIGVGGNPTTGGHGCGSYGCPPVNSIRPEPSHKPDYSKNPFLASGSGQTAFSGNGQQIKTGTNGFLGVQPVAPFANNDYKAKPFVSNYPQANSNQNPRPRPINNQVSPNGGGQPSGESETAATHPCNAPDETCVAPHLCVNGLVVTDGSGLLDRRHSGDNCESENNVCCRLPEQTSTSKGSSTSGFVSDSSSAFPSRSSFPNIFDIKNGQKPGSVIKFDGGAGISPGLIKVISDNEAAPNPQVYNSGASGSSGIVSSATSDAPVFAVTPDYSNDDLSHISFVSTIQGPQYLPPIASPQPDNQVPVLIHEPSIATYEPSIPTPSKPILPGPSLVSVHPTPLPFVPSSPQPFIPVRPVSQYTPKPTPFEVFSSFPSSPKPFVPQRPIIPFIPSPPIIHDERPVFIPHPPPPPPFFKPKPEITPTYQPSTPVVSFENRIKPSESPSIPEFSIKVTPGYKYPTPTPQFVYPSPSTPSPSISINDNFIPVKPRPTPIPFRPSPTPSYEYKKPTPSFPLPTIKPFNPQPSPSDGYEYKQPTPSFPTPLPPIIQVTNGYLPPIETQRPYNPQPEPSDEFEITRPPLPPTNNQYLPPREPDGSNNNEFFVSKPTVSPPPHEGQPDIPIPDIVPNPQRPRPIPIPRPQPPPSPPQGGCAAALKCVQEIYCTAEGIISPVPVILSKAQQLARVPTTECTDREAGIIGRCCRDPNYVDPWPSANSINGFDDGQYKEDPNLGQYYPQQAQLRPRSGRRANAVKAPVRSRSNTVEDFETAKNSTFGVRNVNSQFIGQASNEVPFAQIPWQAMILRDSTRTLLCGGAIVKPNAVLTNAECLNGLATSDILIKGGEWKLGIDEEPLPFQIVKVAAIIRHPLYKPGFLQNDLALLMLEENLRLAKNIAPIALTSNIQPQRQQCIATGWGKRILQVHLRGAIMKAININILDNKQCGEVIQDRYKDFLPNFFQNTICGFSKSDQCDVDYGSALACSNGNGKYSLAGIFSWDTGCKDDGQIGGYIPADVEWIEDTCAKPIKQLKALDKKYNSQY